MTAISNGFSKLSFLAALSVHSITGFSLGISPLRILRDSTHEGEESRLRIVEHLTDNPKHFSALRSDLQMGKGNLDVISTSS
jgi:hypothetical protein